MKKEIITFEEHGEVLSHWAKEVKGKPTLISFDRHLDLKLIERHNMEIIRCSLMNNIEIKKLNRDIPYREDDKFAYGLDDFLYVAIKFSFFSKIVWVYPKRMQGHQLGKVLYEILSLIPTHGNKFLSSFQCNNYSASVKLNNVELYITNIEDLGSLDLNENIVVDIDMDYFYNPINNSLYNEIDYVLDYMKKWEIVDSLRSMAYSVSSGFLPDSFRWISQYIAKTLGYQLHHISGTTKKPLQTIVEISSKSKIDEDYINRLEHELFPLGGVGWKLKSILYIRAENLRMAEQCYLKAREEGDNAYWAAYTFGVYYMTKKKYKEALKWFQKCTKVIDSIEAHSIILNLICCYNLNLYEEGYSLSKECISLLPMRKEGYEFGQFFSAKLNIKDQGQFEHKYQRIKNLTLF